MMTDRPRPHALPLTALAVGLGLVLAGCGDASDAPDGGDDQTAEDGADEQEVDGGDPGEGDSAGEGADEAFARAQLSDAAGNAIGQVSFTEVEGGVQVDADLHDLQEGFRGLHIHEHGLCEPQSTDDAGEVGDFLSAGGHLPGEGEEDLGVVEGEEAPETEDLDEEEVPGGEPQEDVDVDAGADHPGHAGDLPNLLVAGDGTAQLSVVTDRLSPELLSEGDGTAVIVHAQADNHGNVPERYAPFGPDEETLSAGDAGERTACGVIEEQ